MSSLTNSNKRARHDSITSEGDEDMLNDLSNASQTADFKWLKKPEKKHILRIMDDEYPCLAIIKSPCNRQSTSFSAISIQKLDEDTVYSTSFVSCDLCDAIFVGNGGHLKRHRDKSCPVTGTNGGVVANGSSTQSSSQSSSKSDFDDALIEYFAKTAKPLYSLETKPLRELLVRFAQLGQNFSGDINDNIVLKRGAARSMVDAKLTEKTNDIYKLLQPFFERKSVSVLADFGKLNFDFLSIKCGYLETIKDDNGIDRWALVIAPVAMAAVNLESKDGESVYKSILESLETCHQNADAKDCYIVADGGSNVRSAGKKYFGGYIRCAAHASEIIGKRMLNPYKKEKTTAEDKRVLAKYTDLMEKCKKLTQTLKADKFRYRDLGVSLVEPVPTRWMSGYICTFQVCDNISKLKDHIRNLSQKSRDLIMEISGAEYRALFDEMNPIYKSIAECNEYFQKNSTNISEVILAYVGLLDDVEEIKERFQSSKNQKVLLKFADKAIKKQLNDLVGAHYVSYYLNPTYKSLEDLQAKFDHHLIFIDVEEMAMTELKRLDRELNGLLQVNVTTSTPPTTTSDSFISRRMKKPTPVTGNSLQSEINSYNADTMSTDPMYFWLESKHRFPRLFRIAEKLFSCPASEAEVERSFSQLKNVYTDNRQCLDLDLIQKMMLVKQFESR